MTSVVALLLSAGGLFAANTAYPMGMPASASAALTQGGPADALDRSIVLEQTYDSITFSDEPAGTSRFLQHLNLSDDASTLPAPPDGVPLLSRADFPQSPNRFAGAFLSRSTRQALAGIEQTPVGIADAKQTIRNEIIPPPSALWSGILMVAGLMIYKLHRKIMYLS